MAEKITLHQYDNGIKVILNITKDGLIEPLSGATVFLKFREKKSGYEFDRKAIITDENNAECEYTFTKEDLTNVGSYIVEVETHYNNGTVLSCKNPFILVVMEETFNKTESTL